MYRISSHKFHLHSFQIILSVLNLDPYILSIDTYTHPYSEERLSPQDRIPYINEVPFTTGSKSIEFTNKSHSF